MPKEEIAISVEGLSKTFRLPHEKTNSLKRAFLKLFRGRRTFESQKVLKSINFEIKKGEFFGIVGRNGSGKSTLLKLLAGIYAPDKGSIKVSGKLTPFIELGVGFNPELTGRENVYLNGALLGFSRKEMITMYDDIVAFAELERFMDQKLKNYSSGMQVRLAFSIAIRAKSDILLIDEVLAVGDIAFQKKCIDYFKQLKKDKQTVVLVSHDMATVEKYCDRALLIHNGVFKDSGNPKKIAAQYRLLNLPQKTQEKSPVKLVGDVTIDKVTINERAEAMVNEGQDLTLEITYTPKKTRKYIVSMSITRADDKHIAFYDTREKIEKMVGRKGATYKAVCRFESKQFLEGVYRVDVDIRDENDIYLAAKEDAVRFSVTNAETAKAGVLNIQGEWQVKKA